MAVSWWRAWREVRAEAEAVAARDRVMLADARARAFTIGDAYDLADPHLPGCPQAAALAPLWVIGRHGGPDPDSPTFRPATTVHHPPEPCAWCGADVLYSTRDTRRRLTKSQRGKGKTTKVYCDAACKAAGRITPPAERPTPVEPEPMFTPPPPAAASTRPACPNPQKRRYATEEAAAAGFADLIAGDPLLRPYECPCGLWHVGHAVSAQHPDRAHLRATIADVARITPLRMPAKKPTPKDPAMPNAPVVVTTPARADAFLYGSQRARDVADQLAAEADERARYASTPLFDELAAAHGQELWPPVYEDHDGFLARHGQMQWLNDALFRVETAVRLRPATTRPRDASGRFTR